ncbi:MAG: ABC transporter substrate-binding protein, partial [Okeania sp. SIO3C4]|nr:ABC transporter substrate-binding protein [Okeania sp. SIO3C4]
MLNQKRRQFLQLILATTGLTFTANLSEGKAEKIIAQSQEKLANLAIGGSPIMITILLAYLAEQSSIKNLVETVDFRIWKTHDQLRADAVSGKLQVSATPTSLAANLYQRKVPIKLLNVLVWGVLNIWSNQNIRSFEDLKNKTLLIAFRGGLPAQLFFYLAKENGLDPEKDLKIQYTTDFAQAVQLLLAGRGDAAILSEPAGTGAELRGQQQGLDIKLAINLQEEWGKVT